MIREIMLVPFPRAASRRLISFFTFQISICWATQSATRYGSRASMSRCATHVLLRLAGVRVAHGERLCKKKTDSREKWTKMSPNSSLREEKSSAGFVSLFCMLSLSTSEFLKLVVGLNPGGVSDREAFYDGLGPSGACDPHAAWLAASGAFLVFAQAQQARQGSVRNDVVRYQVPT